MTLVRPLGNLDAGTISSCVTSRPDEPLEVDLRQCTFIRPAGLVWLGVALEHCASTNRKIKMRFTPGSDVAKYVDRMGLGDHARRCGAWIIDELPTVRRYDRRLRFLELTRFDSVGDSVIDDVCETVKARSLEWEIDSKRLYNSVFELGVNVEHHAHAAGFVAVQHYPGEHAVEFAIGDCGIGILESLKSAGFDLQNSHDAIRTAVETYASRTGDEYRGRGLPDLRNMLCTDDLLGALTILSGDARVHYVPNETEPRTSRLTYRTAGTIAVGRFRTG